MGFAHYEVRFIFIHHSNDDGQVEICKGGIEIADEEGLYDSVKLFDLPNIGDIVTVPRSNEFWIVSCTVRRLQLALDMYPTRATVLLCEQTLYSEHHSPDLYVGFEGDLVGVIRSDRIFKPLQSTEYSGFSWGYSGAGPQHVSRSILFHYLGEMPSDNFVLAFERDFVGPLEKDEPFLIESRAIRDWISSLVQD